MPVNNFNYQLSWSDFTQVPSLPGGASEFAQIHPDMNFRNFVLGRNGKSRTIAEVDVNITLVNPDCMVEYSKSTNELLRHEQLHYDIIALTARELYNALKSLSATSVHELQSQAEKLRSDFQQRAAIVDARYDSQTKHARNTDIQSSWESRMTTVKQNPRGTINDLPS